MIRPKDKTHSDQQYQIMVGFMDSDQRGTVAFERFRELLDDLSIGDEAAMAFAFEAAGKPGGIGEKAVKQWFSRKTIPPYAIFNLAEALGIDVTWLAGSDRITKEKAIHKGGAYYRELERVERIRAEFASRQGKRTG